MKPTKSEKIYKGRIFELKKETFKLKGNIITREIIYHPGSALMIPVLDVKKKTIIMIKQYRHAAGGEIIEFPAGTKDKGESYRACASRELVEEIGYKPRKVKEITRFYLAPGTMTEIMALFLCTNLKKQEQDLEIDEKIKPFITTVDEAVRMVKTGKIKDAKTILAVLMLRDLL